MRMGGEKGTFPRGTSSGSYENKAFRGVWTTCSFVCVLVTLVVVLQSSSSALSFSFGAGNSGNKVSSSSWRAHKKSVLTALHDGIRSLEAENKELRAVVYHLARKQRGAQGDPQNENEEANLKYHVEQFEARQRELQSHQRKVSEHESRMRLDGRKNSIRMGDEKHDNWTSSITADNDAISVTNPQQVNVNAGNVYFGNRQSSKKSDDGQIDFKSGESMVRVNSHDVRAGHSSGIQVRVDEDQLSREEASTDQWSGIQCDHSRFVLNDVTRAKLPVQFDVTGKSRVGLTESSDDPNDSPLLLRHREKGSVNIGARDGDSKLLHANAGKARWTVEEDKTQPGQDFDYDHLFDTHIHSDIDTDTKISMGQGKWVDPETDVTYPHSPSLHLDSGDQGSNVFVADKASFSVSSSTYASGISNSSDFGPYDVALEALPYDSETLSAMHFSSGYSHISVQSQMSDEFDDGAEVQTAAGEDLHALAGGSSKDSYYPGSIHVDAGEDVHDPVEPKQGNVHIGGGEGFNAIITATLSINFTQLDTAQGIPSDIYAANVSLIDVTQDSCGVPSYRQCSRFDMLFVNSPEAVMSGNIIDEASCLAYIWAKPYRKAWWDPDVEHVSNVNFLIVQRLNAEVDRSSDHCDDDELIG